MTIRNTGNTVQETVTAWSNLNANTAWTNFTYFPINNYAGQTIRIHMFADNDVSNNTNFFIDSMALTVVVCL